MSHFTLSTSNTSLKNSPLVTERNGIDTLSYFNVLLCFSISRPSISQKKLLILFFEGIPQVNYSLGLYRRGLVGICCLYKCSTVWTHTLLSQQPPAQTYQMVQEFKSVTFVKGPRFFNL